MVRFNPSPYSRMNPLPEPSNVARAIGAGSAGLITGVQSVLAPQPAVVPIPLPSEEESSSLPLIIGGVVLLAGLGTAAFFMLRKPADAE